MKLFVKKKVIIIYNCTIIDYAYNLLLNMKNYVSLYYLNYTNHVYLYIRFYM